MAATVLLDADQQIVARKVAYGSTSDSVLPASRLREMSRKRKAIKRTATKRGGRPKKARTVSSEMKKVDMARNDELLIDLQDLGDLQSILAQHTSGNTHGNSFCQEVAGVLDGTADHGLHDQGAASQPRFGQQPKPFDLFPSWMGEELDPPHSAAYSNDSVLAPYGQTSCQFLSLNQPVVTQPTDSSKFATTAIPQNSQIASNPLVTQSINISAAHDSSFDAATSSELGIGSSSLAMLPFPSQCSKETRQMVLNSYQGHSIAGISRNPRDSFQPSGKLLGILSSIFQALNNPHIEELQECYANALKKALTEIQAATGQLVHDEFRLSRWT